MWEMFKPKIPNSFIEGLQAHDQLRSHLVRAGTESTSWVLSYEAGSGISTSLHLAAAEQLSLAPVTDSAMHHQLLLHKSLRRYYDVHNGEVPITEEVSVSLAHQVAFTLVQQLLPAELLHKIMISDILAFRVELKPYRKQLITDLQGRFATLKSELEPEHLHQIKGEVVRSVSQEVREFQNAVAKACDKIWASLVSSINKLLDQVGSWLLPSTSLED
jgi:hypothetical protein